jgi:hypothetical protein
VWRTGGGGVGGDAVLREYRAFHVPQEQKYARLHQRWAVVSRREAFVATRVADDRLVANYSGYANNSATSEVARTFR